MKARSMIVIGLVLVLGITLISVPALARQAGSGLGFGIGRLRGPQSGLKDAAGVLGMDVGSLCEQRLEGKSLAHIAADKGLTRESLAEKLVAIKAASLEKLVDEGKIDEDTAVKFLDGLTERIEACIEKTEVDHGLRQGAGAGKTNYRLNRQRTGANRGYGQCCPNQLTKSSGK
ncbi:MAG TPA: hypothetical protein GX524_01470 [Firmicutes bacterium]|jgi:polyhydroxyalkanoate synthesis regulator phasin|nr:hypothetical protein [Bacillota bacterium]